MFCTALTGREITRITGCFGLDLTGSELVAEAGQQVAQPVVEEILREKLAASDVAGLALGVQAVAAGQGAGGAWVDVVRAGTKRRVTADWVIGCEGARSVVREALHSRYDVIDEGRPNFSVVFRAKGLAELVPHGPAVHYWVLNAVQPGVIGRFDLADTWWCGANGVDQQALPPDPHSIIRNLAGTDVGAEILSTDAWQARTALADRWGSGRLFIAGEAAHQNPPWGGHGFNTGIGDAANLGWKLAAVINGWAPAGLLGSYELERRPVAAQTIDEAVRNMASLGPRAGGRAATRPRRTVRGDLAGRRRRHPANQRRRVPQPRPHPRLSLRQLAGHRRRQAGPAGRQRHLPAGRGPRRPPAPLPLRRRVSVRPPRAGVLTGRRPGKPRCGRVRQSGGGARRAAGGCQRGPARVRRPFRGRTGPGRSGAGSAAASGGGWAFPMPPRRPVPCAGGRPSRRRPGKSRSMPPPSAASAPRTPPCSRGFGYSSDNEDCLYLNVFSPADAAPGERLPVMVWIHGGGLFIGSADGYDSARPPVERGRVVVVTFSYRLGVFGFFSHPVVNREGHQAGRRRGAAAPGALGPPPPGRAARRRRRPGRPGPHRRRAGPPRHSG